MRFVRGELDAATLLERAATTDDPRSSAASRRAAALAYVGLVAERDGRADEAAKAYRDCVEAGARTLLEHLWASLRLAGLEPRAPRAVPAAAAALPAPPVPAPSLADQLERLARLRAQGVLNDDEFVLAKRRILGL